MHHEVADDPTLVPASGKLAVFDKLARKMGGAPLAITPGLRVLPVRCPPGRRHLYKFVSGSCR